MTEKRASIRKFFGGDANKGREFSFIGKKGILRDKFCVLCISLLETTGEGSYWLVTGKLI
jgi:hypothetical protein